MYMGIHFVALGSMLAMIGFNVLNLGVLAKTMLARRYPDLRSRTVSWFTQSFRLELGLVVGAALFLVGLGIDGWILHKWLTANHGGMESTTHLAFVATTTAVLGLNVAFSSFLLALMVNEGTTPG